MSVNKELVATIESIFGERFGKPDTIVRSPGRINLIGEHTDYNMGFVLPASIDKAIYLAVQKRNDRQIQLVAADLDESHESSLDALVKSGTHWPDYILGVIDVLQKNGFPVQGFNAVIGGDVPLGAGLSSSAAVECATVYAMNTLFGLGIDRKTMVQFAQKAENDFVGLQCGIMDMFASMFGEAEKVIRLDCRSLEYAYMPFPSEKVDILLLDTGVKHSLASSEYNLRRQECERGVAVIAQKYPSVKSLRDATIGMVEECLADGDAVVYKRCRYVTEEIRRLQNGCEDLAKHDFAAFGQKMFTTHRGLSELYEVSCPEADALVTMVGDHPDVLGARMMGGGFGGCTINMVKKGKAEKLAEALAPRYFSQFDKELKSYLVAIDKGTSLL
ncbi:galactokinase [Sediminibacterium soli]|uniref:galactokinase n=1 Tax=Sediminibacterium soli TaxID=2698829 RepID=UPI00137AC577|nr:galactokinase [Sediminibacterium soli]NCI47212.1 galactokinase [Sediminibacterium soli]